MTYQVQKCSAKLYPKKESDTSQKEPGPKKGNFNEVLEKMINSDQSFIKK